MNRGNILQNLTDVEDKIRIEEFIMTMKELAQIAGVSSASVSRYINGGPLSQEKRDRIRTAMKETGYQPDTAAQTLRTGVTDHVGLIVPKIDSDAVARFTAGAAPALAQAGFLTLLADTANDTEKELTYLSLFQNRQVAGIIMLATILTPQLEEELRNVTVPVVVAGQQFRQITCVYHDDFGAAYELTNLILKKGRKKIAYIGVTEQDIAVGLNRRKGVQMAMKDYGMQPECLLTEISPFSVEGGKAAMERLLSAEPDIDGVICATDRIAFGAMEVLHKAGKKLPEDVSITGMDDHWAGEHILPHLSTAHFYYKTSGERAAKLLIEMIQDRETSGPVNQIMLGYTIKIRDSI